MTTNWLPTNSPANSRVEVERKIAGVKCKVSLSPYDIPQAIRGYEDEAKRLFIVELKYLTEEATVEKQHDEFTRVDVGQNSNRLYRIKIDIEAVKRHVEMQVLPQITKAIETTLNDLSVPNSGNRIAQHYSLTRDVILNNREKLFSNLEAAGK